MDVKAIIVVGYVDPASDAKSRIPETFAGMPLALSEVLGKSVLARTVQRLRHYGISQLVTVCDPDVAANLDPAVITEFNIVAEERGLWRAAEAVFNDFVQKGAELVLVMRLGRLRRNRLRRIHPVPFGTARTGQRSRRRAWLSYRNGGPVSITPQ